MSEVVTSRCLCVDRYRNSFCIAAEVESDIPSEMSLLRSEVDIVYCF